MRNRRRHLVGTSAALLIALAVPSAARGVFRGRGTRRRPLAGPPAALLIPLAVPSAAHAAGKPFILPQARPTEERSRPTDDPDPNRNAYSVPEAKSSPACSAQFC